MELPKKYDHKTVEQDRYQTWKREGYFESGDKTKEPYTIVIPPPNVTGKLHLGHAWDNTMQDIIIRRKRMQGYDALFLPGMDHAGIATQAKIDARLRERGTSRYDLGREAFLEEAWAWKEEYAKHIREQWEALGISVDYNKERFTLDEGLNDAVNEVFIRLYKKGLIYRKERIINWDIEAKTALSNIEVEHKEVEGALYYFKYYFEDKKDYVTIATTRPETMFADTALMVHPSDQKHRAIVGKKVYIPTTDTLIPIIEDDYVDTEFGTGIVKVTPAHDPNDFQVGERHNLPMPSCIEEDGSMNAMAHKYEGMNRFECRKALVKDTKDAGLLEKVETIIHNVGHSERTGVIVEPRLSMQWFVDMTPLANKALEQSTAAFVPPRFEKIFKRWMENIQDWCISRQLWWGHRIPAYYKDDDIYVGDNPPKGYVQDEDVLDTWFSSALWPFSTLGWPEETEDFKRYYPTDAMVTGYDIIFFWVARMIFQGLEFTGETPFKHVLIHGLIRDSEGRKMSKSLGNGVDPMDVKKEYGMDTLRYYLTTNSAPGQDLRFEFEKVESSWNYINKLWNISRFILMHVEADKASDLIIDDAALELKDKWILTRFEDTLALVDENYEKFEFGEVAKALYTFVWEHFANWYIEASKITLASDNSQSIKTTKAVVVTLLRDILKLLHPFMPFVTEAIYQKLPNKDAESIMISAWPTARFNNYQEDVKAFELIQTLIQRVRNKRNEYGVIPSKPVDIYIETSTEIKDRLLSVDAMMRKFLNPDAYMIDTTITLDEEVITVVEPEFTVSIPMGSLIDIKEEIANQEAALAKVIKEIRRAEGMLNNKNFVNKAPAFKVEEERHKLQDYKKQKEKIEERLEALASHV
ncbi:MAG: valine--tRNA ligase [Bacillota bacterium]